MLVEFRNSAEKFSRISEEVQLYKADRVTNRARVSDEKINPTARNILRARRERHQRHRRHKLASIGPQPFRPSFKLQPKNKWMSTWLRSR